MDINAPTQMIFVISLILVALAVVAHFVAIPYATEYQFWLAVAGYVVLAAGCFVKM
jgi:heme/copper-type cytochrome/quinol oxidase subunit 1